MVSMHLHDLPERTQDYLKVVWDLSEHLGGQAVPLKQIAQRTGQKVPTATEAIKRLAAQGLVHHERYAGVSLTKEGKALAMGMVRRHRLLETFLVQELGYTWDEVHADADLLEHACSDRFIERLDAHLGSPTRDPHGDPIPDAQGVIDVLEGGTLDSAPVDVPLIIQRVCDEDSELLRYLDRCGIGVGDEVVVAARIAGLVEVRHGADEFSLAEVAARDVTVRPAHPA